MSIFGKMRHSYSVLNNVYSCTLNAICEPSIIVQSIFIICHFDTSTHKNTIMTITKNN